MIMFMKYSYWYVKILYCVCFFVFFIYFLKKWNKSKIVFTPFNFQVIFFAFIIFVVSPFQYNYLLSNTWSTFSTQEFIIYLNEAYTVNLLGFIAMGISMAYYEKKQIKGKLFRQMLNIPYANIRTSKVYNVAFIVGIIYVCYIVVQSKGIPILNGKRFYVETGQFVYLLINAMTYILAWYCVGTYAGKRVKIAHTLIFIILVTGLLMTGNRTPILRILYAFFLMLVTFRNRLNYKTVFKQLKYIVYILGMGILLILIRNGNTLASIGELLYRYILYGSTFCDIRDGARVLWGYHGMYTTPLYGKTFLASLLSFVPTSAEGIPGISEIARFRQMYSGGTWSTKTLFGIENHYGLRGGMFLPAYTNYGIVGIFVIAVILGYWFGNCEILFEEMVKEPKRYDIRRVMFSYCFVNILFELLYAPAGFNSFWGYLVVLFIIIAFSGFKIRLRAKEI